MIPKIGMVVKKTFQLSFGSNTVTTTVVAIHQLEVPGEEDEYVAILGNGERIVLCDGWDGWE